MFAGPIIAREVLTVPRPLRFYIARGSYVGLLFILMWTAWQSLIGWREVREYGVLARFGGILFQFFVFVQLTLMLISAPLAAATSVAHEKDRRTFMLLLMTDLSDVEIVLGKLTASLLQVVTLLAATAPVFFLCMLLGGVSPRQVLDILGVTAAAGLVAGSLGLLVALWRDRTFQSLALTVLLVVLSQAIVEAIGYVLPDLRVFGVPLASTLDPYRVAIAVLTQDHVEIRQLARPSVIFMLVSLALAAILIVMGVVRLRAWNPDRDAPRERRAGDEDAEQVGALVEDVEVADPAPVGATTGPGGGSGFSPIRTDPLAHRVDSEAAEATGATTGLHVPRRTHRRVVKPLGPYRRPWGDYPILWRELRTRAYGTKPLIIKGAYVLAFALGVAIFRSLSRGLEVPLATGLALIPVALGILSLVLVNTQGVTALTSERDSGALDLLLVTELTPRQFIFSKLFGVLYNTKEMILPPIGLAVWFAITGVLTVESAIFAIVDFLLLCHFAAMLGLHAAITYTNSRTAVAHSLGTICFLMVGILTCAGLIILSDREFGRQLVSFLIFIGAGSVALFGSLGAKNPSRAIALVSLLTPFWTFYCVIGLLNGDLLAAFLVSAGTYGFALLAMFVPAVSDFDIALGRTGSIQG